MHIIERLFRMQPNGQHRHLLIVPSLSATLPDKHSQVSSSLIISARRVQQHNNNGFMCRRSAHVVFQLGLLRVSGFKFKGDGGETLDDDDVDGGGGGGGGGESGEL